MGLMEARKKAAITIDRRILSAARVPAEGAIRPITLSDGFTIYGASKHSNSAAAIALHAIKAI